MMKNKTKEDKQNKTKIKKRNKNQRLAEYEATHFPDFFLLCFFYCVFLVFGSVEAKPKQEDWRLAAFFGKPPKFLIFFRISNYFPLMKYVKPEILGSEMHLRNSLIGNVRK